MFAFRCFLSRRWLLALLGGAALFLGLAMLHPYPRQSVFGPRIRGKPWCAWEAAIRRHANKHEPNRPPMEKFLDWLGVDVENLDVSGDALNDIEFLPLLLLLAEDRDHNVRWHVLTTICNEEQLHDSSACPVLRRCLELDDSNDRIEAAVALWHIAKDRQAMDVIVRELNDTNTPHPRYIVMFYFQKICEESPELYAHFLPLARNPDSWIRKRAMSELYNLGQSAVPVFCQGLEDREWDVRVAATASLWSLGDDAKAAVPALELSLRDREMNVRRQAALALKKIEPERFGHLRPEPR
jgi:hypothetical protein